MRSEYNRNVKPEVLTVSDELMAEQADTCLSANEGSEFSFHSAGGRF